MKRINVHVVLKKIIVYINEFIALRKASVGNSYSNVYILDLGAVDFSVFT